MKTMNIKINFLSDRKQTSSRSVWLLLMKAVVKMSIEKHRSEEKKKEKKTIFFSLREKYDD